MLGGLTYGVAKNVSLHAVRILDCMGDGTVSDVIAALDWLVQHAQHPAVAVMSLGGEFVRGSYCVPRRDTSQMQNHDTP